jgi:hypothetical protein
MPRGADLPAAHTHSNSEAYAKAHSGADTCAPNAEAHAEAHPGTTDIVTNIEPITGTDTRFGTGPLLSRDVFSRGNRSSWIVGLSLLAQAAAPRQPSSGVTVASKPCR